MIASTPTQRSAMRPANTNALPGAPAAGQEAITTVPAPVLLTARIAPLCGLAGATLCVESVGREGIALLMTGIALVLGAIGLCQLARARLSAQLEAEARARGEADRALRERAVREADALLVALCRHAPLAKKTVQPSSQSQTQS